MIFVTGGCFQGKQQWVLQNCQVQPFRVADGAVCSMEAIKSAGVLDHFHLLVRRWMQAGKIPADETEKILSDNPDIVIITDEIGSGIVPLDVKEREWREVHGRICCQLAGRADAVFRVIAGIGQSEAAGINEDKNMADPAWHDSRQ